jgi:ABC-type sugar transport system ATPase subunit
MEATIALLQLINVSKRFPGVTALDRVSFDLDAGEVHALIGENGAGKSTLMKIVGGIYQPSDGEIRVAGQPEKFTRPSESRRSGIAMVHQEPKLCGPLSVAENLLLGALPRKGGVVSWRSANEIAANYLARVGLKTSPSKIVDSLSIAEKQLLQVARALVQRARILVLDEPTASLTPYEVDRLFQVVRDLKGRGVGTIYISHHLDEIFEIGDRVTVLKDGRKVSTQSVRETNKQQLIGMMVGRELGDRFPSKRERPDTVFLEVDGLSGPGFHDVSLKLHRGEVLGIAGLVGAGRTELARALCGAVRPTAGHIRIDGKTVRFKRPAHAVSRGLAYIAEDRRDGLFMPLSVRENITVAAPGSIATSGVISTERQRARARAYVDQLNIRTPDVEKQIRYLSGGNQQKCILARWLLRGVNIMIFDEPTRGIDVGAKSEIYKLIDRFARAGNAVILISSELTEVLGMADRVMVMSGGRMTGELSAEQASEESILALALPGSNDRRVARGHD